MATTTASGATDSMDQVIKQPLDLIRLALGEVVRVKMRGGRELRGKLHVCYHRYNTFSSPFRLIWQRRLYSSSLCIHLSPSMLMLLLYKQAYDSHLNIVLGDVEETAEITETDEKTDEEVTKVITRTIPMLFVRGDCIILIAPPLRTASH